jgi:hypothetical protein
MGRDDSPLVSKHRSAGTGPGGGVYSSKNILCNTPNL